ncbi:hypothetical protein GA0115246_108031, partial [Streptomyces sp. SolWspMP-sol7th]
MSTPPAPKVAGTHSPNPSPAHNADTPAESAESSADASLPSPASAPGAGESRASGIPARASLALQERLASWLLDLSTLHELSERLHRTRTTEDALGELLRAGAVLLGAERGLVRFTHAAAHPARLHGHGLDRGELGRLEALPEECTSHGALLAAGTGVPVTRRDLLAEPGLDPRCAAVARSLGCAATYAVPLCDAERVFASALSVLPRADRSLLAAEPPPLAVRARGREPSRGARRAGHRRTRDGGPARAPRPRDAAPRSRRAPRGPLARRSRRCRKLVRGADAARRRVRARRWGPRAATVPRRSP